MSKNNERNTEFDIDSAQFSDASKKFFNVGEANSTDVANSTGSKRVIQDGHRNGVHLGILVPRIDEDGQPVVEIDEEGNQVVQYRTAETFSMEVGSKESSSPEYWSDALHWLARIVHQKRRDKLGQLGSDPDTRSIAYATAILAGSFYRQDLNSAAGLFKYGHSLIEASMSPSLNDILGHAVKIKSHGNLNKGYELVIDEQGDLVQCNSHHSYLGSVYIGVNATGPGEPDMVANLAEVDGKEVFVIKPKDLGDKGSGTSVYLESTKTKMRETYPLYRYMRNKAEPFVQSTERVQHDENELLAAVIEGVCVRESLPKNELEKFIGVAVKGYNSSHNAELLEKIKVLCERYIDQSSEQDNAQEEAEVDLFRIQCEVTQRIVAYLQRPGKSRRLDVKRKIYRAGLQRLYSDDNSAGQQKTIEDNLRAYQGYMNGEDAGGLSVKRNKALLIAAVVISVFILWPLAIVFGIYLDKEKKKDSQAEVVKNQLNEAINTALNRGESSDGEELSPEEENFFEGFNENASRPRSNTFEWDKAVAAQEEEKGTQTGVTRGSQETKEDAMSQKQFDALRPHNTGSRLPTPRGRH
jgi:hypothetical protein